MSTAVQIFSCPRCNRGGFRSLPDLEGKAHCPWCGDRVAAGAEVPPPPAPGTGPSPAALPKDAAEVPDHTLRDRLSELVRRCEQAEAELRREQDKKQEIKRAVMAELGQLSSQLAESKASLQQKEAEFLAVLMETKGLKEDLAQERKRAEDLLASRGSLEDKVNATSSLGEELEATRKSLKEAREARDGAGRDAEQARSELAKAKNAAEAELGELKKKLNTANARGHASKTAADDLKALKAQHEEYRGRSEKERAELQEKAKSLQAELEKRDQRIRELQLLIKTLGERLNDLSSRHFGIS